MLTSNPAVLSERLRARGLSTVYVREYYFPFRMMPDRMLDLETQIQPQRQTPLNRDFAPIAYYFDIALWSSRFQQGYQRFFATLAGVKFSHLAGGVAIALLLLLGTLHVTWLRRSRGQGTENLLRFSGVVSAGCVAAMGFTLLALEILLLLGFQVIYGFVYHQLAVLIAAFMVGMAWGSRRALSRIGKNGMISRPDLARQAMRTLAWLQAAAAFSPLILYGIFVVLSGFRSPWSFWLGSHAAFPTLALLAGMLGGYQFPLASQVYFTSRRKPSPSLGTLYGIDLLGACLGALALSAYLVPVFGVLETGLLIAVVNLVPAGWAAFASRA
jgi:spermidine synthase